MSNHQGTYPVLECKMRLAQRLESRVGARRRNKPYSAIDVSAHASVLLALLILVTVHAAGGFVFVHGTTVELVKSRYATARPGALREDTILVSIPRDGATYVGRYRIRPADLPDAIREALQNGAERKVYLKVDARAKYGDVMYVLAEIRRAGIGTVCFVTR